ncbi:MAG: serine/threonine protein kinase [Gammaproteobacteria bacterium]|nr:serine/threonine protein kinase [Gammaproteobacteria bacterium]MBU2154860.1 serine/threonine protein kinase [Gammaproteobacteria bacterium]MBU2255643.1 serine/threonine protein kinase [Gammaproteobacteria bacterium]MBU2296539.1 serine/threonine protein kinase [Gammaproteobacteria bacterium]
MSLASLSQAGRSPELPQAIELADAAGSAELILQQWLRVLPGQRYVAQAQWRGRSVLAKLLVGSRAARHFQRERDGAHLLAELGLPTPQLLVDGLCEGEGGWLLFEYLDGAESLWDAWRAVENQLLLSADQQAILADALVSIAQMHAKGLWQADLHLDNLLRHNGQLFVIDGGGVQVEVAGQPLSRGKVLENLGMFFAQLPVELTPLIEELLVHYLLTNGEHALPLEALLKEVEKVRKWRLRDYLRKIARDCSLFAASIGAFGLRVVRRESQDELLPLLNNLDLLTEQGHIYKTGGAATVAQVQVQGHPLVVKRYNIKGFTHWLKRFWRPSRAWHSWVEGNRLQLLGIVTPQPLAVVEQRWCWLRGRAYLITEYCSGQDIIARFNNCHDGSPPETELLALDRLFAALLRERISHGDFKGHNLFWDEGLARWSLIDLDAMQQHRSARSFARAYARDRARFLRNWPADSALHQLLNQRIPLTPVVGSAD